MNKVVIAAIAACSMISQVQASDVKAGEELGKSVCAGCHGADGVSPTPMWPNLKAPRTDWNLAASRAFLTASLSSSLPLLSRTAASISNAAS